MNLLVYFSWYLYRFLYVIQSLYFGVIKLSVVSLQSGVFFVNNSVFFSVYHSPVCFLFFLQYFLSTLGKVFVVFSLSYCCFAKVYVFVSGHLAPAYFLLVILFSFPTVKMS